MDVNVNAEVRGAALPQAPVAAAIEKEDRVKPQIAPVAAGSDSVMVSLDARALQDVKAKDGEAGKESGSGAEKGEGSALTKEQIESAVAEIRQRLEAIGSNLTFGFHEDVPSQTIVVQIKDRNSDKVVRQFPQEDVLQLKTKLNDLVGLLFDRKA